VKNMAKGFYGRIAAYDEGLSAAMSAPGVLVDAIRRNVYGTAPPEDDVAPERLAAYLRAAAAALEAQPLAAVLEGRIDFAAAPFG
jgi:cytochrome b pre-mRNA-processing protein 3